MKIWTVVMGSNHGIRYGFKKLISFYTLFPDPYLMDISNIRRSLFYGYPLLF